MRRNSWSLCASVVIAACGDDAEFLTSVTQEQPGFTCVSGGVRIETGRDDNGDGALSASEVEDSNVVCNGSVAQLTRVTAEPAGTNCAEGGARVEVGFDDNGNQAIDPDEIDTTSFICSEPGTDPTKVVQASTDTPLLIAPATLNSALSATIVAPGPGTVVALYSGQAFCFTTECPAQQTPPDSGAFLWLTDAATTSPAPGESRADAYLTREMSLLLPLQDTYAVAAGSHTYTVHAVATVAPYQLYDQSLTLVFVPD